METMQVDYPENFELAVGLTKDELTYQIKLMAALKMFELGKISSGKAAQFIGTTRIDFFEICSRYKISMFNYPLDEIERELSHDLKSLETI